MKITLDGYELETAAAWGCRRQIRAVLGNLANSATPPNPSEQWYGHIIGAMAEFAVAKAFDKFIGPNMQQFKGVDIKGFGEVKCTHYFNGKLLVKKNIDNINERYILVVCDKLPEFNIVGYIYGKDAMVEKYWDASLRYPCYAVPQKDLRNIGT